MTESEVLWSAMIAPIFCPSWSLQSYSVCVLGLCVWKQQHEQRYIPCMDCLLLARNAMNLPDFADVEFYFSIIHQKSFISVIVLKSEQSYSHSAWVNVCCIPLPPQQGASKRPLWSVPREQKDVSLWITAWKFTVYGFPDMQQPVRIQKPSKLKSCLN